MIDCIEKNKELCARYPFLIPRNVWTDEIVEDYDYSYIRGDCELPTAWNKLFLQMCEDIREPLIKNNYLDKFRFSQVKEKYGTMRCYTNGCPEEVYTIIDKYSHLSQFICSTCGKPAKYITNGWIASYCEDCYDRIFKDRDLKIGEDVEEVEFNPIYKVTKFSKEGSKVIEYDCSNEWNKLFQ